MLLQDLSFYDVANFELVHIDLPKSLIVIVSKILQKYEIFYLNYLSRPFKHQKDASC